MKQRTESTGIHGQTPKRERMTLDRDVLPTLSSIRPQANTASLLRIDGVDRSLAPPADVAVVPCSARVRARQVADRATTAMCSVRVDACLARRARSCQAVGPTPDATRA